jgi:D-xylose transport system permease protein
MNEPTPGADSPADDPQAGSVTYQEPEETIVEEEEVAQQELATTAPEVLADSLSEYLQAWGKRIRSGESGAVPVLVGLVLIIIFFRIEQSTFLGAENLVNLFVQAALYILFAAAEIYALLLSEIDLSVGAVAGVGGFAIAELIAPPVNMVWWLGIACGLLVCLLIGLLQGSLITRLHLPSFVVTLGGLLGFTGVIILLAQVDKTAVGGVISISTTSPVYNLVNANMSPTLSWIVLVVVLAVYAGITLSGAARRRRRGLSAAPISVVLLKIGLAAIGGIAIVYICTLNRGSALVTLEGVPWVLLLVLLVIAVWSFVLERTRTGRYIYAIGANPEAARRAGINVPWIRTIAFMLCSFTAGLAGLVYASRLGSIATDIEVGNFVLFAVAAAVIGGTSLFGGRGKMFHALLGGFVIATVFNGLDLMGISAAGIDIATAIVLILAVTVDSLVRRRGATGAL